MPAAPTPRPAFLLRRAGQIDCRFGNPPNDEVGKSNPFYTTPGASMRYLCLIAAEKQMEHMPKADADKHFEEYRAYTEDLRRGGHLLECNRLEVPRNAKTVRVRNGKVLTTDGPYTEAKEHIGGYYLIEANDMNEAVRLASLIPGARFGCVEVRPVADDPQTRQTLGNF
jgi:hypothetical protein